MSEAHRKEVFQSKVLQRLYPSFSKPEEEPSPPPPEIIKKLPVTQKVVLQEEGPVTGDGGITASSTEPLRRVYTVLASPAEYKTGAEGSVTLSQPSGINTEEDPADESAQESNEDGDEGQRQPWRRRRRKRRGTTAPRGGPVTGRVDQVSDSNCGGQSKAPTPTEKNGEWLSKNKRRKLKKKRHKEKLLSLGLLPRAASLEFTYQRGGCWEEEGEAAEEEETRQKRAAEVIDFLRTTNDIYVSDSERLSVSSEVVDGLLTGLSNGTVPPAGLAQLHSLKSLVQKRDTAALARALQELQNSSDVSPDEATAIVSLFQYWTTEILPMQRDQKTSQPVTQPS